MHRETLFSDPAGALVDGGQSLEEEAVLRTFLTAWAKELLLPTPRVPIVRPTARPMAESTRWIITGGLAAATPRPVGMRAPSVSSVPAKRARREATTVVPAAVSVLQLLGSRSHASDPAPAAALAASEAQQGVVRY